MTLHIDHEFVRTRLQARQAKASSTVGQNFLVAIGYDGTTKNAFAGIFRAADRTPSQASSIDSLAAL